MAVSVRALVVASRLSVEMGNTGEGAAALEHLAPSGRAAVLYLPLGEAAVAVALALPEPQAVSAAPTPLGLGQLVAESQRTGLRAVTVLLTRAVVAAVRAAPEMAATAATAELVAVVVAALSVLQTAGPVVTAATAKSVSFTGKGASCAQHRFRTAWLSTTRK